MALRIKGNKTLLESRDAAIKKAESLGLLARQPALLKYLNEKGTMKIMLAFGTGEDKRVDFIGDYDGVYAPIDHTHNYAGSDIPGGPANSLKNAFGIILDGQTPAITFNGTKNVSVDITPESIHASRDSHTHPSSKIVSLDGYNILRDDENQEYIQVTDTLNKALKKLEYSLHNLWEVNSIFLSNGDSLIPNKLEFTGQTPLIKFGNGLQIQKNENSLIFTGISKFKNETSFEAVSNFLSSITVNGTITTKSNLSVSGNSEISGITTINNKTESTSIGNGALLVLGGTSIAKNLNVGGNTNIFGDLDVTGKINVDEIEGNAATATKLQTPRNINGTAFDGTKDITTKYWGTARKITLSGEAHGEVTLDGTQDVDINVTTTLAEDKPLVGLTISPTWTYSGGTSTNTNLVVEKGENIRLSATWKWVHNNSYKDPTSCSGNFGTSLPTSNTPSQEYTEENIKTNKTFTQTIKAKQKGYKVVDNKVVAANAEDSKSASISVSFRDRLYYGVVTSKSPDEEAIKKLANELVTGRGKTITGVSCAKNQYYCYAYPESLGNLAGIIQDGATPVLTAFNITKLTITNAHGLKITLNVYISANDGAFSNSKLQFS